MTYSKLFILLCVLFPIINAHGQMFEWAKTFGGSSSDFVSATCIDNSNNIISVGWFAGTADFDPQSGTTNLTSQGFNDIYVQKLDADGNLLWVHSFGSLEDDYGTDVVSDAFGNIYITGHFSETVDFDPGVGSTILTSHGYTDNYVLKLSAQGDLIWVKQTGGSGFDYSLSIAIDDNNNIYTTGSFEGNVDFDPGTPTVNLSSNGGRDVFIQKIDELGDLVWARSFGGGGYDLGTSLSVDVAGMVHVAGTFASTVDFDPGTGTTELVAVGADDYFVQKLDPSGNFIWARAFGSVDIEYEPQLDTDYLGNVYTVGSFTANVDFDPGLGSTELSPSSGEEAFMQKLDNSGEFVWVRNLQGSDYSSCSAICVDSAGNVLTTGSFQGNIDIDPGLGTRLLYANGSSDVFIHKLDTDGNLVFGKSFGGSSSDSGGSVIMDSTGNVFTSGSFRSVVDFDPASAEDVHSSIGGYDAFIQKLIPCTTFTTGTDVQTAIDSLTWIDGITYYSDNNSATYTLENSIGCDSVVTLDLTVLTSGLDTDEKKGMIDLHPNPTAGKVSISLKGIKASSLILTNAQGQVLITIEELQDESSFDLSEFPSGIYFLNIESEQGNVVKRIVKE